MSGRGQITSGLNLGDLVLTTISFVRRQLPRWRDDPERPAEQSEPRLNSQLCKFLNASARTTFPMVCFQPEEPQTGTRRVDFAAFPIEATTIGVRQYTIYDAFLVMEGKRLPPTSSRDYVTGGIQRFKRAFHGATLQVAAMIGYVQQRSLAEWHTQINSWIDECGVVDDGADWTTADRLQALDEDAERRVASCISNHSRIGQVDSIRLYHLWIVMSFLNAGSEDPK